MLAAMASTADAGSAVAWLQGGDTNAPSSTPRRDGGARGRAGELDDLRARIVPEARAQADMRDLQEARDAAGRAAAAARAGADDASGVAKQRQAPVESAGGGLDFRAGPPAADTEDIARRVRASKGEVILLHGGLEDGGDSARHTAVLAGLGGPEGAVFCRLAETQASMYAAYLRECSRVVFGNGTGGVAPLQALQNLQRLCTSATLLMRAPEAPGDDADETRRRGEETGVSLKKPLPTLDEATRKRLASQLPSGHPDPRDGSVPAHHPAMSGKLTVLMSLLASLREPSKRGCEGDRAVVVSGWTSTLDVIAAACAAAGVAKISRLDGSVPPHLSLIHI